MSSKQAVAAVQAVAGQTVGPGLTAPVHPMTCNFTAVVFVNIEKPNLPVDAWGVAAEQGGYIKIFQ